MGRKRSAADQVTVSLHPQFVWVLALRWVLSPGGRKSSAADLIGGLAGIEEASAIHAPVVVGNHAMDGLPLQAQPGPVHIRLVGTPTAPLPVGLHMPRTVTECPCA